MDASSRRRFINRIIIADLGHKEREKELKIDWRPVDFREN